MEKLWLKDWRQKLNQFKNDLYLWSNEVKSTVIIMVSQPKTRSRETLKGDCRSYKNFRETSCLYLLLVIKLMERAKCYSSGNNTNEPL